MFNLQFSQSGTHTPVMIHFCNAENLKLICFQTLK